MNQSSEHRTFLVVIDESPEHVDALRYACQRAAANQGRVAMLYVIEPHEIYLWAGVEDQMDKGQEDAAHATLATRGKLVEELTKHPAITYVRHGDRREALLELIKGEPTISLLVLAASTAADGPGPLLSYFTSTKGIAQLSIPLTVVPQGYFRNEDV